MNVSWTKRSLYFKQPAGTSRGVMKYRDVWYITLKDREKIGIGECAPLPGLSPDNFKNIESKLDEVCLNPKIYMEDLSLLKDFPSIRFGLEMAQLDLKNGGGQTYFESPFNRSDSSIAINGLIWMGAPDFMVKQVEEKLNEGWQCIKMKIGALDFESELKILRSIRSIFGRDLIELRVDANGAFTENDVEEKLDHLGEFKLHSIEQPLRPGQWDLLADLCKSSPVPIALDEELIHCSENERIELLDKVNPQFLVLKPSLLGGFSESEKWVDLAEERKIGWWITSALESNIGLNALSQWTAKMKPIGFQGLGTGQLFKNNIPSPLKVESGKLWTDTSPVWKEVKDFISAWMGPDQNLMLQTSGSTGTPKSISVKKEWMKNSAKITGKTFGLEMGDSALLCLPMKYVAGKMMVVRALECGLDLKVMEPSSNPLNEMDQPVDFAAMVPLQLENSLKKLEKINTLIVGGGKVNLRLIESLQSLSTKVYETYGMTETLSHVAIKPLNGPNRSNVFRALKGIHFEKDNRECLAIHAPMLREEPVITNDIIKLIDKISFRWLGRFDHVINSGGVKIIPELVEEKLESLIQGRRYFVAGLPHESLGEKVVLVVEGERLNIPTQALNRFERPKEIHFIPEFFETASGKVNQEKTIDLLS